MTDALRPDPLVILDDFAVVFDDGSRIRWSRAGTGRWLLAEHWPTQEEIAVVDQHLESGGRLLVMTDGRPIITSAFGSELPPMGVEHNDGDVIEVTVAHFDWLPDNLRARGETFLCEQLERWASVPALLRPPLIFERAAGEPPSSDQVAFALLAPGIGRSRWERKTLEYLAQIRGAAPADVWASA